MYWLKVVYIYRVLNFRFFFKKMSDYVDIHSIFLKFIPFWELKINVTQQNISQMVFLCPWLKRSKTELHFPKDTAISRIHGCNPDRLLELNYYFCANTFHYNVAFPKDKKYWELRFLLMNRTQQSLFLSGFKKHQVSRVKLPAQALWTISPVRWRSGLMISSTQGCHTQITAGKNAKKGHSGQSQKRTTVGLQGPLRVREHWRHQLPFQQWKEQTVWRNLRVKYLTRSLIMWFSNTISFVIWTT